MSRKTVTLQTFHILQIICQRLEFCRYENWVERLISLVFSYFVQIPIFWINHPRFYHFSIHLSLHKCLRLRLFESDRFWISATATWLTTSQFEFYFNFVNLTKFTYEKCGILNISLTKMLVSIKEKPSKLDLVDVTLFLHFDSFLKKFNKNTTKVWLRRLNIYQQNDSIHRIKPP